MDFSVYLTIVTAKIHPHPVFESIAYPDYLAMGYALKVDGKVIFLAGTARLQNAA